MMVSKYENMTYSIDSWNFFAISLDYEQKTAKILLENFDGKIS